jgi:hypothetical protein
MHTNLWLTILSFHSMAAFMPLSALALWRRPALWPYLASMFFGLCVAFIDLGASEVQVPALLLIGFTFFTGFASPRGAWRWGIITGIWTPVFHIVQRSIGTNPALSGPEVWGSLLAPVFALAGSYAGSFTRSRAASKEGGTFSPHGEYNG